MGWQGRCNSQVAQDEPGLEYPFLQWVNRGGDLDPRRQDGGFFMTEDNVNMLDALPVGAQATRMNFSTGNSEGGVFMESIVIAPLTSRFSWVVWEGGKHSYSNTYTAGARGKLNVLCYIKTNNGMKGPISITLTGTVTQDMGTAMSAHRQRVRRATKGQAPSPLFVMTLEPGDQVQRGKSGKQSRVTPIVMVEDFDADDSYVGDPLADEIEKRWQEFKTWKEKWCQPQEETGAADDDIHEEHEETVSQPTDNGVSTVQVVSFKSIDEALAWSVNVVKAYADPTKARTAYEQVRVDSSPQSSREMWGAWQAHCIQVVNNGK